jgi:hypothetical protein
LKSSPLIGRVPTLIAAVRILRDVIDRGLRWGPWAESYRAAVAQHDAHRVQVLIGSRTHVVLATSFISRESTAFGRFPVKAWFWP